MIQKNPSCHKYYYQLHVKVAGREGNFIKDGLSVLRLFLAKNQNPSSVLVSYHTFIRYQISIHLFDYSEKLSLFIISALLCSAPDACSSSRTNDSTCGHTNPSHSLEATIYLVHAKANPVVCDLESELPSPKYTIQVQ